MFKKLAFIFISFGLVLFASGCAAEKQVDKPIESKPNAIMNDFNSLVQKDSAVDEIANFINNNISDVSKEDASRMVDKFEIIHKKNLSQLENMFFEDSVQNKINLEYKAIIAQTDIKDAELKELLAKTKNSGYKIETAEGSYFPIIDYDFYKNFSSYVTSDMKDYIDIMAVESNKVPAKDGALVIEWDEVLKRALNQEKFIQTHKDSVKINEIKQLHKKYATFALYGLNNTPLFSYDTKTLDPKAREVYLNTVTNAGDSDFLKTLDGFLNLVKDNNFMLTNEAEKYRENVVEKLDQS
ncbi:hypothetical protein [Desulforamulus aquiferis]|uniref:Uncharacterized protein n=1 Tax=Desulforamulus aquiferis TaxID=1397668 RepID=A0AAW7ZA63_9FIRM|nr:hypothetical protein [Desulforamulus aquiferis]MDO7786206.1 hypothetical protein [Desulforamulus aquiferis]